LIEVEYRAPPIELSPYVSAFYLFTTDESGFEDLERADIAQLRFALEGGGEVMFGTGVTQPMLPVSIMGPRTKATRVSVHGPARLFGVGLLPAGWAAFTGLHADKHINSILDGAELLGPQLHETRRRLIAMRDIDEMAALMTDLARNFSEGAQKAPHWFIRAVDDWLNSCLSPDIDALERSTNLSRRQIERLCRQLYGSPPKLLVRKYRALRTANAISHGKGDWQDFIDDAYYDQPHCIREVKEFVGITPSAIRAHTSRLTSKTFDRSQLFGRIAQLSAET
jgi:AraC-like DNA-binding protein